MQISKLSLALCAVAFAAVTFPLRAADADTEQKLREALRQKLNEGVPAPAPVAPVQPAPTTPPPVTAPPKEAAPAPKTPAPAKSTYSTPVLNAPPPVAPGKIEEAREALRKSLSEMQAQQPAPVTPGVTPSAVAAETAPATGMQEITGPAPVAPEKLDSAREALHKQKQEVEAVRRAQEEARRAAALNDKPGAYEPLRGPPVTLPEAKQQRLQELLAKYRADAITPEEYHRERAKILAE